MGPEDLASVGGRVVPGFFATAQIQMLLALLQDIDRGQLRVARQAILENEEARRVRDDKLRRLHSREVFSAGSALLTGPDGRPDPRPVDVAVTDTELVLLDADPRHAEEEIARIPRSEIRGVRLLDENGEPIVQPPTELEELDLRDRRYVVWVDHEVEGKAGGHAFVFLAWRLAAEAERDFRRLLPG